MKKLIIFFLILFSSTFSHSQVYQKISTWQEYLNRFRVDGMLRVPLDTLAGADSGSVAIVGGNLWNKIGSWKITGNNLSNSPLTATGEYIHNWAHHQMLMDSVNWFQIKGYETDGSIEGKKTAYIFKMYPDISAQPLSWGVSLKKANGISDSLQNFFSSFSYNTQVLAQANLASGTRIASITANAYSLSASIGLVTSNGPHQNFFKVYADSIDIQTNAIAATIDTFYAPGPFKASSGSNKLIKVPVSSIAGRGSSPQTFFQTSTVTVSATNTETSLIGSGYGSRNILSSAWYPGKSYKIIIRGVYSTDASNPATLTFKLKLGPTVIATSGGTYAGANKSNIPFELEIDFTAFTIGSAGTVMAMGMFRSKDGPGMNSIWNNGTTSTIDMTTSQMVDVSITLSDGSTGNSVSAYIVKFKEDD